MQQLANNVGLRRKSDSNPWWYVKKYLTPSNYKEFQRTANRWTASQERWRRLFGGNSSAESIDSVITNDINRAFGKKVVTSQYDDVRGSGRCRMVITGKRSFHSKEKLLMCQSLKHIPIHKYNGKAETVHTDGTWKGKWSMSPRSKGWIWIQCDPNSDKYYGNKWCPECLTQSVELENGRRLCKNVKKKRRYKKMILVPCRKSWGRSASQNEIEVNIIENNEDDLTTEKVNIVSGLNPDFHLDNDIAVDKAISEEAIITIDEGHNA